MAAEMKVTDAAVRAAADVMEEWHNDPGDKRGYNDAMRAALEAALAAVLEPVGRQFQDRDGRWHGFLNEHHERATEDSLAWPMRSIYTIKDTP